MRDKIIIGVLCAVVIGVMGFVTYAIYETDKSNKEYEIYYASLSEEEKKAVDAENAAKEEAKKTRYEVVSVFKYAKNQTNNFGGVIKTEIAYSFDYIDKDGNLRTEKDFINREGSLSQIIIGDCNQYIIEDKGLDTYRYLQLTKETLQKMNAS